MDWIERVLNMTPIGGNDVLGALLLATFLAVIIAVGFYVYSKSSIGNINV